MFINNVVDKIRSALGGTSHEVMSHNHVQDILDVSESGILEWDVKRRQIYGNEQAFAILGLEAPAGWVPDQLVLDMFPQSEHARVQQLVQKITLDASVREVETYAVSDKGQKTFVKLRGKLVFGPGATIERVMATITDVSEQRRLEKRLKHEALHDFLTGLPNKTLLVDRIQHVLARLRRSTELNATLLFMDIDDFKAVNDNLGHGFGDDVLASVGERLAGIVRDADTVARIGSDEFVILLEDPTTAGSAHLFADRLLTQLQQPLKVQSKEVRLTFSIGLVLIDDPEASVEAILGDADIAMYTAKDNGKGQVVPFDTTMRLQAEKRMDVMTALQHAMDKNELYLAFQPIFAITGERPEAVGVEALLRWTRSTRGNIAPGELLAVAEENGMIEDIGFWVIDTAILQLARWRELGFPEDFYINVNLSSRHFDNAKVIEYLLDKLREYELPRSSLRIEIVESAVIRNPDRALTVIEQLKMEGIRVSIDDFGTGFSSLSYLHRFPFYALKIDRSFVIDVVESKATQDIVMAIIAMAKKLDIRVVAEGIENDSQLQFLKDAGCEFVQGFLLARPELSPGVEPFFMDSHMVANETAVVGS